MWSWKRVSARQHRVVVVVVVVVVDHTVTGKPIDNGRGDDEQLRNVTIADVARRVSGVPNALSCVLFSRSSERVCLRVNVCVRALL